MWFPSHGESPALEDPDSALARTETGAIVATPTTSLPEDLGGVRWDYRYCWLRDSVLTLDALLEGGYVDEALAFGRWALRARRALGTLEANPSANSQAGDRVATA